MWAQFFHHSVCNFLTVDDIARLDSEVVQMYPLLMMHFILQHFAKFSDYLLIPSFDNVVVESLVEISGTRIPHSNFLFSVDPVDVSALRVVELRPSAHFRRSLLR